MNNTIEINGETIINDIIIVNTDNHYDINIFCPVHTSKIWRTRFCKNNIGILINDVEYTYNIFMFDKCYVLEIDRLCDRLKYDENLKFKFFIKKADTSKHKILVDNLNIKNMNTIHIEKNSKCYVTYSDRCDVNSICEKYKESSYDYILIFTKNMPENVKNDKIIFINWIFDIESIEQYATYALLNSSKYITVDINTRLRTKSNNLTHTGQEENIYIPKSFNIDDIPIIYDIFVINNDIYMIGSSLYNTLKKLKNIDISNLQIYVNGTKHDFTRIKDESTIVYKIQNKFDGIVNVLIVLNNYSKNYIVKQTNKSYEQCNILTTIFKNENHLIEPWIEYYSKLGFNMFILYNNNPTNKYLYDYLTEKYENKLIFVDWGYQYYYDETKVSGQSTQQNHALYKYKSSNSIGMLDLDEYVMSPNNTLNFLEEFKNSWNKISAISFQTVWFGCGNSNLTCDEIFTNNYIFLRNMTRRSLYSCGPFRQQKCIINPKNVDLYGIHNVKKCNGLIIHINSSYLRMNHYFTLSTKKRICDHQIHDEIYDDEILKYL